MAHVTVGVPIQDEELQKLLSDLAFKISRGGTIPITILNVSSNNNIVMLSPTPVPIPTPSTPTPLVTSIAQIVPNNENTPDEHQIINQRSSYDIKSVKPKRQRSMSASFSKPKPKRRQRSGSLNLPLMRKQNFMRKNSCKSIVTSSGKNKYVYNYQKPGAVFGQSKRACNVKPKMCAPELGAYEPKFSKLHVITVVF